MKELHSKKNYRKYVSNNMERIRLELELPNASINELIEALMF